ncbi:MAG: radical SAM protein [Deltaproteobacteria bacterium]|nr:radical SAM protein [Deltaproteobacteria bacterium]
MNIDIDSVLISALEKARLTAWKHFGRSLEFYLPGMFVLDGQTGLYPAVSLTGKRCQLGCDHCQGQLLTTMIPAVGPETLRSVAKDLKARGRLGMLISGGSNIFGRLPWESYWDAIETIIDQIGLTVTVHAGYLDIFTAKRLRSAGVRQALVDIIGDDQTAREVYHLSAGTKPIWETMEALTAAGLEAVPHIVVGLAYGQIRGENQALEGLIPYNPKRLVTVVFRPLSGTPMADFKPPQVSDVAWFLVKAREMLPETRHHLGCARPRGVYGRQLEALAIQAGINALALPSEDAWAAARNLGLEPALIPTCCSLAGVETNGGKEPAVAGEQ